MTATIPHHRNTIENSEIMDDAESMQKYHARFCLNTVAPQKHTVFQIDQSSLRPITEKRSHWSIAWSDLMMTMFILFLSLFVYQAAHKDLLVSNKKEIVAGKTEEVVEVAKNSKSAFPFVVIKPAAPLMSSGTVQKVESISLQEVDLDATFSPEELEKTLEELASQLPQVATVNIKQDKPIEKIENLSSVQTIESVIQPLPLGEHAETQNSVNSLFDKSQITRLIQRGCILAGKNCRSN